MIAWNFVAGDRPDRITELSRRGALLAVSWQRLYSGVDKVLPRGGMEGEGRSRESFTTSTSARCPHADSNCGPCLRRAVLYPLSYGGQEFVLKATSGSAHRGSVVQCADGCGGRLERVSQRPSRNRSRPK